MTAIIEKEKLYKNSKIFNYRMFNKRGLSNHKKVKKILDGVLERVFECTSRFKMKHSSKNLQK